MSTYNKYKPVTFEYVKQIPEDWQLLPNIAIFEERNEKGQINEELLSVTIGKGVIKQSDLNKKDSSNPDKSNYKLVEIGDVVYSMRFRQGASGYSNYKGLVSNACTVLKPKMEINPKFFHYQYRLPFYQNYAERYSYGIADGQKPLRWQDFKRMYAFVPPIETQNRIVAYLEEREKQIKKFIKKKKELIIASKKELEHYIYNLSTGKLDANNKTNSGILYLNEVPIDWDIKPLKAITTYINRGTTPDYVESSDYKVVNQATFSKSYWNEKKIRFTNLKDKKNPSLLKKGDLLLASTGGGVLGKVWLFNGEENKYVPDSHVTIIRNSKNKLIPEFLYYFFKINYDLINALLAQGSTNQTELQKPWLKSFKIAVPNDAKLIKIIDKITHKEKEVNKLIQTTEEEIKLAEDLLKSQIEQVVTGKIQVPNTYKETIDIAAEPATNYKTL